MISRRSLISTATLLLASSVLPAEAATKKKAKLATGQIYLFRGFANVFSMGLDTLGKQLAAEGIKAEVLSLPNSASFAKRIADRYKSSKEARPIVLIGHSLGADMTFAIASALKPMKIPVELIISFDPTGRGPVPGNVKKTLNFFTGDESIWSPVLPAPGFKGELSNINLRQGETAVKGIGHFNVDKNPELHARSIQEIKKVLRRRA
ncbi:thioesterase domain-containing protein [Rhizobium sp. AAP43]|uniref:thioesterase domain-containing protein n=1 Tax=Rhizobium sp. AAP43 TaxID=1523420 RepID=UPI0006B9DEEB|nr:thioesterase domain-containing protein [Rhizobium sp. AAP43]KPF43812.1 hypothetical protein IP76_13045 [Rhizobium sp. AAP43]